MAIFAKDQARANQVLQAMKQRIDRPKGRRLYCLVRNIEKLAGCGLR